MKVIIEYDKENKDFILYNSDLNSKIVSKELFNALVIFDEVLRKHTGNRKNVLNMDDIEYELDSYSMRQIITSNVKLLKRISKMPSEFQAASSMFNNSSSTQIVNAINKLNKSQSSLTMEKPKGMNEFKLNKKL
jgi:hypothetical protein